MVMAGLFPMLECGTRGARKAFVVVEEGGEWAGRELG